MVQLTPQAPDVQQTSVNTQLGSFQRAPSTAGLNSLSRAVGGFLSQKETPRAKRGDLFNGDLARDLVNVPGFEELDQASQKGIIQDAQSIVRGQAQDSKDFRARRNSIMQKWLAANEGKEDVIFNTFERVTGKKFGDAQKLLLEDIEQEEEDEIKALFAKADFYRVPTTGRNPINVQRDVMIEEKLDFELAQLQQDVKFLDANNALTFDDVIKQQSAMQSTAIRRLTNDLDRIDDGLPKLANTDPSKPGTLIDTSQLTPEQQVQITEGIAAVDELLVEFRTDFEQTMNKAGDKGGPDQVNQFMKPIQDLRDARVAVLSGKMTAEGFRDQANATETIYRAGIIANNPGYQLTLEHLKAVGPILALDSRDRNFKMTKRDLSDVMANLLSNFKTNFQTELSAKGLSPEQQDAYVADLVNDFRSGELTPENATGALEALFPVLMNSAEFDEKFMHQIVPLLVNPEFATRVLTAGTKIENQQALAKLQAAFDRNLSHWIEQKNDQIQDLRTNNVISFTSSFPFVRVTELLDITSEDGFVIDYNKTEGISEEDIQTLEDALAETEKIDKRFLEPYLQAGEIWELFKRVAPPRVRPTEPSE